MMVNLHEALAKVKHGLAFSPEFQKDEDTHVANLTYQQGVRAFAQKNYEGALDFFTASVMQLPFNTTYLFALAMTYHALHDENEAISFYNLAWVFEATNPAPCFRLGQCYLTLNKYDDAIESTETAIRLSKTDREHKEILALSKQLLVHIKRQQRSHS
ncbi:tetratricopeptide repeat protein [Vibrio parahaemolyticus]|nr:tetratricopeptide repeat protein [Vibrio parahaemolyticus]EGQ9519413.1 tetratricopeptide repeat protein [Vibrio parahaemolyticus]EHH1232720.1 tetratricopeptide repeat protein [Vibrio parahaemolyticus]